MYLYFIFDSGDSFMVSYSGLVALMTSGPTLLPVFLLKALWEPSHKGKDLDCQQRQTGAFLPGATGYISFMGCASSALSGAICSSCILRLHVLFACTCVCVRRVTVVAKAAVYVILIWFCCWWQMLRVTGGRAGSGRLWWLMRDGWDRRSAIW